MQKKDLAIFLSFSSLLAKLIVGQALAFSSTTPEKKTQSLRIFYAFL
jgi:hypothetical protein